MADTSGGDSAHFQTGSTPELLWCGTCLHIRNVKEVVSGERQNEREVQTVLSHLCIPGQLWCEVGVIVGFGKTKKCFRKVLVSETVQ